MNQWEALSPDLWEYMLYNDKTLSIRDIQHMCSVNRAFREMCKDGKIWQRIFVRQFGREWFAQALREQADDKWYASRNETQAERRLYTLMTWRVYRSILDINAYWQIGDPATAFELSHERISVDAHAVKLFFPMETDRSVLVSDVVHLMEPVAQKDIATDEDDDDTLLYTWVVERATRNAEPLFPESLERKLIFAGLAAGLRTVYPALRKESLGSPLLCARCGQEAVDYRCGGCKTAYYCSDACADDHWEAEHRKVCDLLE